MNNLFEFEVDLSAQTVQVVREFDAPVHLVWEAFTNADLLDQWVAPKPFSAKTKVMEFVEGGRRLYAMVGPDGTERWLLQTYKTITPKTYFSLFNTFADEQGTKELPGSSWDYSCSEQNGKTTVRVNIFDESKERMEKMIAFGFKEGYTASMNNLEQLLGDLQKEA